MLCFRVGDIKSATVSSQLIKMKTAKMKKMQVVNLLFLPFNFNSILRRDHQKHFLRSVAPMSRSMKKACLIWSLKG